MSLPGNESESSDLQYCWQLVRRAQPLFQISSAYLPRQSVEGVLAIFALCASIEEVFFKVADESVACAKLAWWADQLSPSARGSSGHPVIRALHRSGAIEHCGHGAAQQLVQTSLDRVAAKPPANPAELRSLCLRVGWYPMQLELAFTDPAAPCRVPEAVCAVNGLVQLLREGSRRPKNAYQWLPMDWLARHGISRYELGEEGRSMAVMQLISEACLLGESWSTDSSDEAARGIPGSSVTAAWAGNPACRHCFILAQLNLKLLGRLKKMEPRRHARAFSSVSLADSWHAWRSGRQCTEPGALQ